MNAPLIWLHDEALRSTHPVFSHAPTGTKAIFVWDERYFAQLGYSLKRLVFIYETLSELPVDIIQGDTVTVIRELAPTCVYIPASNKPGILSVIDALKGSFNCQIIHDEDFVVMDRSIVFRRFFPYWNLAKKTAFQKNGGCDA